jgi:hypothetical protein
MDFLRIKAGPGAYERLMDGSGVWDRISAYFGPAAGPRWLVASGFDLALMRAERLGRVLPVWLIGSSAGAWRFASWLQPEPEKSYEALREAYTQMSYRRGDTPEQIHAALLDVINAYLEDDAIPFALNHKRYRLAVLTARTRHLAASEVGWVQKGGLALCLIGNLFGRANLRHFAERIVFFSGPRPPAFCLRPDFRGRFFRLSPNNFKQAVLASGAIPLVVTGVRDIFGAPRGVYRDGGLIDYHLTHDFALRADDLVLFFHHQERIVPGWLDKKLPRRKPAPEVLDRVLMVFPSEAFLERLPYGKVPDRDDFLTFIDDPAERIRYWRRTVEMAAPLGEMFLELVESGRIRRVLERF